MKLVFSQINSYDDCVDLLIVFSMHLHSFLTSLFPSTYHSLNAIEISQTNILHNFSILQNLQSNHTIIPVLKSNAYGHGLKQIASIFNKLSVSQCPLLAIDSYPEYQILRDTTKKQILVLGETLPYNYRLYDSRRAQIAVGSLEVLHALIASKKSWNIHLFLNTGMNREGFQKKMLGQALKVLQDNPQIKLVGVMSHLACAELRDNSFTHQQIENFKQGLDSILSFEHKPQYIHISNSAGLAKIHDPIFTASRSGLALYGYNPLEHDDQFYNKYNNLKPALRFTTTVTALQDLTTTEGVNYGLARKTDTDTIIATLPIGYNEGLPRTSGDGYQVYKDNTAFPLRGKVCMNLCSIEVGDHAISIGDSIEVIGQDQGKLNTVAALAKVNSTIPYVILTGLDRNIKRVIE